MKTTFKLNWKQFYFDSLTVGIEFNILIEMLEFFYGKIRDRMLL